MRTTKVRADFVEVGMMVVGHVAPDWEVTHVGYYKAPGNDRVLMSGGGGRYDRNVRADELVEVHDPSGFIELRHDVTVYGPFVTSCTLDRKRSGAVHFQNVRASGRSVVLCDLLIRTEYGDEVRLDHVELNHIRDMAAELIADARDAEAVSPVQSPPGL